MKVWASRWIFFASPESTRPAPTSTNFVDGEAWMIDQGMNATGHFTLGWGRIAF